MKLPIVALVWFTVSLGAAYLACLIGLGERWVFLAIWFGVASFLSFFAGMFAFIAANEF